MRILIVLPNWLGDAVMATPAIEHLSNLYPQAKFVFVGSFVSIEALKHHPKCEASFVDNTKKGSIRLISTYKFAKKLGKFDIAITFRDNIYSSLLLFFNKAKIKIARKSWHSTLFLNQAVKLSRDIHLSKQYDTLIGSLDDRENNTPKSKLYIQKKVYDYPTLGINPGATYGSAKRWYPEKFAQVAKAFASKYHIIIFGGPNEVEMGLEIQKNLQSMGIKNYTNLAGKTTIEELCSYIGGLDIFITNDSGPMHVAGAYGVPSVCIFGPTRYKETSQWKNEKSVIVRIDNLSCSPCMKRTCPLKHHECMKNIEAIDVIKAVEKITNSR